MSKKKFRISVVLPAFNEEKTIKKVIRSIGSWLNQDEVSVIVVDDGSRDNTFFEAKSEEALVLRHVVNLGIGAALLTGLNAAESLGSDIIVFMDSDGQHRPEDLTRLINPIKEGKADVVIGSRALTGSKGMPLHKHVGNKFLTWLTNLLGKSKVTDSQSGFKAFRSGVFKKINVTCENYAVHSEILIKASRAGLKIMEVPIETRYDEYTAWKGTNVFSGIEIFLSLLNLKLRGEI